MTTRVLVLKAGSAATNNLVRALRKGDRRLSILGCSDDRFVLTKSIADRNFPIPVVRSAFERALVDIVRRERVDLVIPNSESAVLAISAMRDRLPCFTLLPRKSAIAKCGDKYTLSALLAARGVPVPLTVPVRPRADLAKLFRRFPKGSRLWCRIRSGSGSLGAGPVSTPEQAHAWIRYWETMRDIRPGSFTLSEYLPGADLTVQCLLSGGELFMAKTHQRLEYHVVASAPSGTSSTAALAKIVHVPRALDVALSAIRAVDRSASGVFFVDLKEDERGEPRVTEINAGRFANVPTIHDAASSYNMAAAYVRLALGEPIAARGSYIARGSCYVSRTLDSVPAVIRGNVFATRVYAPNRSR